MMTTPATTSHLVEAIRDLERTHHRTAWSTPADVPRHRATLARALLDGARHYPDRFEYPPAPLDAYLTDLDAIHARALTIPDPRLRALIDRHLEALHRSAQGAVGGDDLFSQVRVQLDGLPDEPLLTDALDILHKPTTTPTSDPDDAVPAHAAADLFRRALQHYDLTGWTVQIHPQMTAQMSVNGPLQRVRVRDGGHFTTSQLRRMLVHEIGGHVLRWANSADQPEPIALIPAGRTVPTEEGLAVWRERQLGVSDPAMIKTYAARLLAVHLARHHGIVSLAQIMTEYLTPEAAVEIALRCKRGLRDPNNPGGPTKDWSYMGGLRLTETAARDNPEATTALGGVKWSHEYMNLALELTREGRLTSPTRTMDLQTLIRLTLDWDESLWKHSTSPRYPSAKTITQLTSA